MRPPVFTALLWFAALCAAPPAQARLVTAVAPPEVRCAYEVRYATPGAERVQVRLLPRDGARGVRTLVIPRAVPMGYEEHPYDRFVSDVHALSSAGTELPQVFGVSASC